MNNIHVNKIRIKNNLNLLAQIGIHKGGGLDRYFGSKADLEARQWLRNMWDVSLNLPIDTDAAANMRIVLEGKENLKPIAIGSHHDTVKNGGKYDGALGVLLATEVLQRIMEEGIKLRHPLAILAFTGEEPNPFGVSTLGSKIVTGKLNPFNLENAVSEIDGQTIQDALQNAGGDFNNLEQARLNEHDISAFIECHIEQGRKLFDKNLSIGIVKQITGIYRESIHFIGVANHAGTTIMSDRHDALLAASEVMLALEQMICDMHDNNIVATVGRVEVKPNSPNIIPGHVEIVLDLRTPDMAARKKLLDMMSQKMNEVIRKRDVDILRKVILDQPAIDMDSTVITALEKAANMMQEETMELISMAGHDAAHMASVTKAGMLFVRTTEGKSHCPQEHAQIDDMVKAGDALLGAVLILDEELD